MKRRFIKEDLLFVFAVLFLLAALAFFGAWVSG